MDVAVTRLAPSWPVVARQQFGLLTSRSNALALAVALAASEALMVFDTGRNHFNQMLSALTPVFVAFQLLCLVGAGWAATVWHNEGPSRRTYHWAMPVRRDEHDLLRVLAGAGVLLAGLSVLAAITTLMALAGGYGPQLARLAPGVWLSYFAGPLIAYLLVSALAVATDHPIRWGLLYIAVHIFAIEYCGHLGVCRNGTLLTTVLRSFFGFTYAIGGYIRHETNFYWANGQPIGPGPAPARMLAMVFLGLAAATILVVLAARARARHTR
jgi:hypothetical protein